MKTMRRISTTALLAVAACGACGGDDASSVTATTAPPTDSTGHGGANACPIDGCEIVITDAVRNGEEITLTFEANFDPTISRNHIHVYWDSFTADQVSNDAAARDVVQGKWIPTDVMDGFTTEGDIAIDARAGSTTLCVTAGDLNHDVIDSAVADCHDVSALVR
jgi:hypothetical protein